MNEITTALSEGLTGYDPVSPHTLIKIADDALAGGDADTAAGFIEMAYEALDEALAIRWECVCTLAAISADVALAGDNTGAPVLFVENAYFAVDDIQRSDGLRSLLALPSEG